MQNTALITIYENSFNSGGVIVLRKVLISTRTFGRYSDDPVNLLKENDFEIINVDEKNIIDHLGNADALIVGTTPITAEMLRKSKLKIIAKHGVGVDNIDLKVATELGIPVTITLGANTPSVAELALAFILALSRNVVAAHCEVFQKQSWPNVVGMEIGGKILGLLGFGHIARLLNEKAQCLGMKVMAHDPFVKRDDIIKAGVTPADFDEIFKEADFISVHVPLTSKTKNLIGERELKSMKRTSFLINTARGHIVNEEALARALKENWIAGAALDVFAEEPLNPQSPLLECQNIIVTPHIGAHTKEAIYRMNMMAAQAVVDFFKGNISASIVVNREVMSRAVNTRGISHES